MSCCFKNFKMFADVQVYAYPSHKPKENESRVIETVVIDDNENKVEDVVEIVSDDDADDDEVQICKDTSLLEEILTKGGLFADVIEKCLELENSDGMQRIVKKTLMLYYRMATKSFLESYTFKNHLFKTLKLLDSDPQHKFTHIKNLCDAFKSSSINKKRVKPITLESNFQDESENQKESGSKKTNHNDEICERKKRKIDVIEIDDKDSEEMDVINLEEDQTEDHHINDREKENEGSTNFQEHIQDTLLTPQKAVPYPQQQNVLETNNVITDLEKKIAYIHKKIKMYEEQEVTVDTEIGSPYIVCEKLKTVLVEHYKTLCRLTGSVDRKPRRIKLNVTEGHPPGPTKILEKFVNERIGGEIFNFPDMMDVVTCVEQGLKVDALEWTRADIVKEAIALFIQCGRALQKSRQRREWKHLLYHVKEEKSWQDDDPAANDPELMAKLELNRMIAEQKESDLIKKYVELQELHRSRVIPSSSTQILQNQNQEMCNENTNNQDCVPTISANTKEFYLSSNQFEIPIESPQNNPQIHITSCKGYLEISVGSIPEIQHAEQNSYHEETIKIENIHNENLDNSDTVTPTENGHTIIEKSCVKTEEGQTLFEKSCVQTEEDQTLFEKNSVKIEEGQTLFEKSCVQTEEGQTLFEKSSVQTKEGQTLFEKSCVQTEEGQTLFEKSVKVEQEEKVKVKTEATEKIARLLESLGDSYTVSVVDIEDPFLIIEISSDSDSDDD